MNPRNIIADYLPLGPDEWIKDRFEHAEGIIEALAAAGYIIVPANSDPDCGGRIEDANG